MSATFAWQFVTSFVPFIFFGYNLCMHYILLLTQLRTTNDPGRLVTSEGEHRKLQVIFIIVDAKIIDFTIFT